MKKHLNTLFVTLDGACLHKDGAAVEVRHEGAAEGPRAGGISIGHAVNIAVAATGRDGTETFRAWKGRQGSS